MRHLDVVQPKDLFRYACPEDVGEMPAAEKGHFCGRCEKVVVDLSCATFEEAVDTIRSAKKSTCVSYSVESSGGLVFRDLLQGSMVVTVAAFMAACQSNAPVPEATPLAQPAPVVTQLPTAIAAPQAPSWPSAVASNVTVPAPPQPVPARPPAPTPRKLAGKPAPRPPAMLSGEPMLPEPPPTTMRGSVAYPGDER